MDLYARPKPGADILYYGNTSSNEGRYWKDYMNSPRLTNGHEIIAFNQPIDLRGLLLAVNFYGGEAESGVNIELRISFDGQTFASNYVINSNIGDGGANIHRIMEREKSNTPTTILIKPLQVLGFSGLRKWKGSTTLSRNKYYQEPNINSAIIIVCISSLSMMIDSVSVSHVTHVQYSYSGDT